MKNRVQSDGTINVTLAGTVTAGTGDLIGTLVGVATTGGVSGDVVSYSTRGVYNMPKLSTDVVAQGDLLYWDEANKRWTKISAAGLIAAGKAWAAAGNGVTTVDVALMNELAAAVV